MLSRWFKVEAVTRAPPAAVWGGHESDVYINVTRTHVEFKPWPPVEAWRLRPNEALALAHTIIREFGETL